MQLLHYSLEGAKKGKVSWRSPIGISSGTFTSNDPRRNVHPLWLTYFNEDNSLNVEESFLQLYTIKNLYNNNMLDTIKIQPSRFNTSDLNIINQQLEEIKEVLIETLFFYPEYLILSNEPDPREEDFRKIAPYDFTLSVVR